MISIISSKKYTNCIYNVSIPGYQLNIGTGNEYSDDFVAGSLGLFKESYYILLTTRFNAKIFNVQKLQCILQRIYFKNKEDAIKAQTFLNNPQQLEEYRNALQIMNKLIEV